MAPIQYLANRARRGLLATLTAVGAACVLAPATALAGTLDQQQVDGDGGGVFVDSAHSIGQTFTAGVAVANSATSVSTAPNIYESLDALSARVAALEANPVDSRVSALEAQVASLQARVTALEGSPPPPSPPPPPPPPASCDKVAAATQTPQSFADSLSAGQTGCFHTGTYTGQMFVTTPNVTLTSYPGERATVKGRVWIEPGADGTTVSNLNLDGRPSVTSPTVSANNVTFRGNDVTDFHTAICFALVNSSTGTLIENNKIHDCGVLPSGNQDHGIYVSSSVGAVIRGNWIYGNTDRGIQLYPDADNTLIAGNIIDSNGEGIDFSGHGTVSDNNTVRNNIVSNSNLGANVFSYYNSTTSPGVGNTVHDNCLWMPNGTAGIGSQVGFTATNNTVANPQYVDSASGNYNLQPGSPCAAILAAGQ